MFFAHRFKSVMTRDVDSYREQNALQVVGVERLYSTTVQKNVLTRALLLHNTPTADKGLGFAAGLRLLSALIFVFVNGTV